MEELIMKIGFGIACFFFLAMLVIGSQYWWGVVVGLAIMLFGRFFDED